MVIPCCILRGFANAIHLFADGVDLDVLRSVVARPAAAHQHDGARVEGGQDRAQGREFMIAAPSIRMPKIHKLSPLCPLLFGGILMDFFSQVLSQNANTSKPGMALAAGTNHSADVEI